MRACADVGAVVAATEPALLAELREAMPRAVFLLPGVGAQGGRVELLGAGVRARARGGPDRGLPVDRRGGPRVRASGGGRVRGGGGAARVRMGAFRRPRPA